jgi:hypothetical protein
MRLGHALFGDDGDDDAYLFFPIAIGWSFAEPSTLG